MEEYKVVKCRTYETPSFQKREVHVGSGEAGDQLPLVCLTWKVLCSWQLPWDLKGKRQDTVAAIALEDN